MKRLLFVDDEAHLLDGLRNLLRRRRKEWDMDFALGGEAALQQLRAAPCDIVVADLRMPGMDGVALLKRVREEFPHVVRVVLSGHSDLTATISAVPVAHQYLSKPIDAARFQDVLQRACDLQELLQDQRLRRVVGGAANLPSLPQVYGALQRELDNPDVSLSSISRIVAQDVALSAGVLRLVNSSFFGGTHHITALDKAVSYLGVSTIKNLALSLEVFRAFPDVPALPGFSLPALQRHCLATAALARQLLRGGEHAEMAFAAGLLHDVGKLVLASRAPGELLDLLATARREDRPVHEVALLRHGVCHAEIGAYLLGLWGLPYDIVEAVAYHHRPPQPRAADPEGARLGEAPPPLDVHTAVYLANALVNEHEDDGLPHQAVEPSYLSQLGLPADIARWRALAEAAVVGA